jgi:hypothetical protein
MLTVREHTALRVEGAHYKHGGARISTIRRELGWSEVRQAQVIASLIRRPDVEAEYPALTRRLRRLEDARRSQRRSA